MKKKRRMIGELMVSLGYVTLEQVIYARRLQMQCNEKRLGECLMELGHTTHDEVHRALQLQNLYEEE